MLKQIVILHINEDPPIRQRVNSCILLSVLRFSIFNES
jgi:hypothetical protein